jgi:nucleotide-binding universal stress UspA family protein
MLAQARRHDIAQLGRHHRAEQCIARAAQAVRLRAARSWRRTCNTQQHDPDELLVPIDFSPCAEHALDYACELAGKLGAKLHLVNAIGSSSPPRALPTSPAPPSCCSAPSASPRTCRAKSSSSWTAASRTSSSATPTPTSSDSPPACRATAWSASSPHSPPRDDICRTARELDVDLIVIGPHGYRGLDRVLGTTAAKVVNHAARNVLVVRTLL